MLRRRFGDELVLIEGDALEVELPAADGVVANLPYAISSPLLFRLFDIWKPPPVDSAESLPGGFGVMADDVVAGIYANLCGQLLWRFVWPEGFA